MKALLLAAGYATRLYPLTLDRPKPLLDIAGRPIINYIIEKLNLIKEINEIYVITNRKFSSTFSAWAKGFKGKIPIEVIDDGTLSNDGRLGAIGDIEFAIKKKAIKEGLLVVGADNIFDAGLDGFIDFCSSKKGSCCIGLYGLADKELAVKYGVVSIDKNCRVTDFQEKPIKPESTHISTCIYYFPKNKLGLFGKYLSGAGNSKDASGNYIKWLSQNDSVYGYVVNGKWFDIGNMDSYKNADKYYSLKERGR